MLLSKQFKSIDNPCKECTIYYPVECVSVDVYQYSQCVTVHSVKLKYCLFLANVSQGIMLFVLLHSSTKAVELLVGEVGATGTRRETRIKK